MVYIIILHWNNFRCTDFCLQSLTNLTYKKVKILIVDNGSTDDSLDRLKKKYDRHEFIFIETQRNLGFSRGTNFGFRYAYLNGADYFLALNNDVEVTPSFIEPLVKAIIKNPEVGISTSKIFHREDKTLLWHAGGHINHTTITGVANGYMEKDSSKFRKEYLTQWASGACSLISRATIDKIGYYDETYFFGQEEWDYSTLAISNGIKIMYASESVVYHEAAGSTTKRPSLSAYQNTYNKTYYAKKYLNPIKFVFWSLRYWIYLNFLYPKRDLHKKSGSYFLRMARVAALQGFSDSLKNIFITSEYLNLKEKQFKAKFKTLNE